MLRRLTPTVLALAIGATSLSAATVEERAGHLEAIKALCDQGLRLPAERAAAAFMAANYPDDGGAKAAVEFYVADVFRSTAPAPKASEYQASYARLQPQIEKSLADGGKSLPADVKSFLGGGGGNTTLLRLVNEVLRVMNPDQPPPIVPLTDEKIEQVNRAVKGVVETAKKDYENAKKKVEAHKADEDKVWDLPEDSPDATKINMEAVDLRMDAVRPLFFAHLALREVMTRAQLFKSADGKKAIDAAPATEFFKTLLDADHETLEKWNYDFGDYHPQLKLYHAVLSGESLRQGVKGATQEDSESAFFNPALLDRDLTAYKDAKVRDAVAKLQLKGWVALLHWQLDMGNAKSYQRGADLWQEFQKRFKNDKSVSLATQDPERNRTLGELYIVAGRLLAAKGDTSGAQSLWSEVIAAKNFHSGNARMWLTNGPGGGGGGTVAWGEHPLAENPSAALANAKAFLGGAKNANPKQQRQFYLNAAIKLRAAVLGLTTSAYEDQFVENAPAVYYFYALTLAKLDMPYHAAIASEDGLRSLAARISEKSNPWKDAKGEWTTAGRMVSSLVQNSFAYASQLKQYGKGRGVEDLYSSIISLVEKVDKEAIGFGQVAMRIKGLVNDEKYEDAIEEAKQAKDKFPEQFYRVFDLITQARLRWAAKLKDSKDAADKEKLKKLADDVTKTTEAVEKKIAQDEKTAKPDQAKLIEDAKKTCVSARVTLQLYDKQYDAVLEKLGTAYWQHAPKDRDLAAQMLKFVAQAVYEWQADLNKAPDAAKLLAAWPRYQEAVAIFKKQAPKYDDVEGVNLTIGARMLAKSLIDVTNQAIQLSAKEPKLAPVVDEAKRGFAEILAPTLDEKSEPKTIRGVADPLWQLGDKAGAARLYELYKRSLDANPDLQAYLKDPAAVVDSFAKTLSARAEFTKPWAELRDLLVDKAGFLEDYRKAQNPRDLPEKKRDFIAAAQSLEAFKKIVASQKTILSADQLKAIDEAMGRLGDLVDMLATNIRVSTRLADFYLSSGQPDKAIPIGQWLYNDYDPLDARYGKIYVEGVLSAVKGGTVDEKAIREARDIAGQNAVRVQQDAAERDTYWMSIIQVMELSAALKDTKTIESQLTYAQKNRSRPVDDLILPPQPGDDPKVHRARDELAATLSERYRAVFQYVPGMKPSFDVQYPALDGKKYPIFVDAGAPTYEARVDEKDDDRVVIVPAGAAAAPAGGEAAPAPADAAAPADGAEKK